MSGTISLSMKQHSSLSRNLMLFRSIRLSSFLVASKCVSITAESLENLSVSVNILIYRSFVLVFINSSKQLRICLISFWKVYIILDNTRSLVFPCYLATIYCNLLMMSLLSGLWNLISKQCPAKDLIFQDCLSLQMQIIGTFVFFIIIIISVIPPLSPLDIPSTSSMIIKLFIRLAVLCRP